MLGGIGNAGEIVFQIIRVMGYVLRRVSDAGETVGVIIGVRRDFAVLVGHRRAASAPVVSKADRGRVGIGNTGKAVSKVVSESCTVLLGVDHGGAVAAQIVFVGGNVRLGVRDSMDQPGRVVS